MKKGFTMLELLGVIFVLGTLLILIIPSILNGVKNMQNKVDKVQEKMMYEIVSNYVEEQNGEYLIGKYNVYCITMDELKNAGKLDSSVGINSFDNMSVEVASDENGNRTFDLLKTSNCRKAIATMSLKKTTALKEK